MAMDVGAGKGGPKSDINVTPLVDVMLVLLIIMMLVAPMLQKGVDVRLPLADNTVDKPETQEQTVLAVDARNQFYVNGVPVDRRAASGLAFLRAAFLLPLGLGVALGLPGLLPAPLLPAIGSSPHAPLRAGALTSCQGPPGIPEGRRSPVPPASAQRTGPMIQGANSSSPIP